MSQTTVQYDFDSLGEVLDEFITRRIEASENDSTTTGERYAYEVVKWAAWLNEERDKWVWDADYYDLEARLREMKRDDYSVSMRVTHTSAISTFYQEARRMADHRDYSLPAEPPANPYDNDKVDKAFRRKYLKGDTKKSKGIESEGDIYYLNPEEISQLVENAPAPKLRNQLIIRLLFDTGLRRGELARIKVSHLDRDEHTIHVPAFKSSDERTVTYTPSYIDFRLEQWLDGGYRDSVYMADESDYLFPTPESEHIADYTINRIVQEAAENAGLQKVVNQYNDGREIKKVSAHTIRHSHAVQAIKSGIDVRRLMKSMGHSELDTTLTYLKIVERDYVDESRKFNPMADS